MTLDTTFGFIAAPVGPESYSDQELYKEVMADCARGTELGYDSIWMIEHHFSDYFPCPNPLAMFSHVAAKHPHMSLGTCVLVTPWYDPIRLAEEIAMLSNLTEGKLLLGLGRGTAKLEYDAFSVDMNEARDRFRESLEVVRGLLSGEPFDYDGDFYKISRKVRLRPEPRREAIEFLGAIGSPDSASIMPELNLAPLCVSNFPLHVHSKVLNTWRAKSEELGVSTDVRIPISVYAFVAESDDEARSLARKHLSAFFGQQVRHYEVDEDFWSDMPTYKQFTRMFQNLKRLSDPDNMDEFIDYQFVGSPKTVIDRVGEYEALGFNSFILHTSTAWIPREVRHQTLRLFAENVMPVFRRPKAAVA